MDIFATLKEKLPINWALIGNPVNWVVVFLMIAIAGAGFAFIVTPSAHEE